MIHAYAGWKLLKCRDNNARPGGQAHQHKLVVRPVVAKFGEILRELLGFGVALAGCDVVIDAIGGTGIRGALRGEMAIIFGMWSLLGFFNFLQESVMFQHLMG